MAFKGAVQFRHCLAVLDHGSPDSGELHLEGAPQKVRDFLIAVIARLGVGNDDLVAQSALFFHVVPFVFRKSDTIPFATPHYKRIKASGKRMPGLWCNLGITGLK